LEKEGKTWGQVVNQAVDELSAKLVDKEKPVMAMVPPDQGSVSQLIEEAKELKKLLDRLGEKMGDDIVGASGPAMLSAAS